MSAPSQPHDKSKKDRPQEDSKNSCGHHTPVKKCIFCAEKFKSTSQKRFPSDSKEAKKEAELLMEKVSQKLSDDKVTTSKAAFILSKWINKKK